MDEFSLNENKKSSTQQSRQINSFAVQKTYIARQLHNNEFNHGAAMKLRDTTLMEETGKTIKLLLECLKVGT